jgi:putative oxidoreductase
MEQIKSNKSFLLILVILRILFGGIFVFSGIMKLIDINSFAIALGKFKILNPLLVDYFTYSIPAFELLIGIFLILNIKTGLFTQIATLLLSFFTSIIIAKIFEGEEISCGCFGNLTKGNIDYTTVLRNIILIIVGILLTTFYQKNSTKIFSVKVNNYILERKIFLRTAYNTLVFTLLFSLAIQTIIFALQNRELKNRIMLLTTDREVLKPGEIAKTIDAINMDGCKVKLDYDKNKTKSILYLFSVGCNPCKKNLPNWINITKTLQNKNIIVFGVAMDSVISIKRYAKNNGINFMVYSILEDEFKINYKVFVTPQTILIDKHGKVIKVWQGLLNESSRKEILGMINS